MTRKNYINASNVWHKIRQKPNGAVVVVIEFTTTYCMQSVPITTDVVTSNLDQGEVYNIMW